MMKITPETFAILQNYSTINQHLILKPGNEIKTIHPSKAFFAASNIPETIERDAAIFDLPRFLRTISLLDNACIEFGEKQFILTDEKGKTKINFSYADPTAMLRVPSNVKESGTDASIRISAEMLRSIVVASKSLKLMNIQFIGDTSGKAEIILFDSTGNIKDKWAMDVSDSVEEVLTSFNCVLKTEYINFVAGEYVAKVASNLVKFESDVTSYWVAVESKKE